jgi:hypothetical protein
MHRRIILLSVLALLLSGAARGMGAEEKSQDPLGDVAQDMKVAAKWLSKYYTDALTRETQKDAVQKLDALIAELEKQRQAGNGSQSPANPDRPMADSNIKSGPGGMGKLHSTNDNGKQWAQLPPHERERILQSMTEGFPDHYQGVLTEYYKRLAEEQPVKSDDSQPTTSTKSTDSPPAPAKASADRP